MLFQDHKLVSETNQKQFNHRMFYVKSHVPEKKKFIINLKRYSISSGLAPEPKIVEKIKTAKSTNSNKQLELFFWLENSVERIIPHFATKLLTTNGMRNKDFLGPKMKQSF